MRLDDKGTAVACPDLIDRGGLDAALRGEPGADTDLPALRAAVLTVLFDPRKASAADVDAVEGHQARLGNTRFGLWLAGNPTGARPAPRGPGDELAVVVGYGLAAIAATRSLVKIDTTTRCLSGWSARRRLRPVLTGPARADLHAYLLGVCRSASARLTSPDPDQFDVAVSECMTLLEVLVATEAAVKATPDGPARIGLNPKETLEVVRDASRAALRVVSAAQRANLL